ncbi:MAG: UDP-N-acetylglucosamine 2-epimerase (non-hydrolyzing) [Acidobacteria bacterium]|nr:UDP-N-acetylglucosamine 2-epimerase (non-hydrolyzing) [Acidobacteriota bacterium]
MKVLTILGTRPEIIRLSLIIGKLDRLSRHVLVHTGQNYDAHLTDIFFRQLGIRPPDHRFEARGSFGQQVGSILQECEKVLQAEKPDRVLILGDTNSSLAAIVAKRLGIPVYHMEAGNRCFDDTVPEEVNRRIVDHASDVLLPYTERSRMNLLREDIAGHRIYVTGNPINEVIRHFDAQIGASPILTDLGLASLGYFLVTMHRQENVDLPRRLADLIRALVLLRQEHSLPVIVSTHPRTRVRMAEAGLDAGDEGIRFEEPFGFFDFIALERNALCVLSDSGTVQEECALLGVPNVTMRDVTERPEALECGSGMLSGTAPEDISRCVKTVIDLRQPWQPPQEYLAENVSDTVVKLLLSAL